MTILCMLITLVCGGVAKAAEPVVIHPLGDSITHGMDRDGYRGPLAKYLMGKNVSFRFAGTLDDGSSALTERKHDGHDGWVIDQITAHVDEWARAFAPDVVLLMIGANDVETGATVEVVIARYRGLLDRIAAALPRAHVLVSEISVIRDDRFDRDAVEVNRRLRELVMARGAHFTFVPMHDALTKSDLRDLDHPTTRGNAKMAERWWTHLEPILAARAMPVG